MASVQRVEAELGHGGKRKRRKKGGERKKKVRYEQSRMFEGRRAKKIQVLSTHFHRMYKGRGAKANMQ